MRPADAVFQFPNSDGQRLAGRLEWPLGTPRAFALFAHCFTCSKGSAAAARIARGLSRLGLAVLRFDFTGLGDSEGEFANTGFSSNVEDLVAAADALRREHRAPSLLIGHSLGGAAVLLAARRIPEVRAVATLAAPSEPGHVRRLLRGSEDEIRRAGSAEVELGGRRFRIGRAFLDDLEDATLLERLPELGAALLVAHSPQDEVVGIDHARRLFEAARHPKSFLTLDGADHLLTRRADAEYASGLIRAWVERYLDPAPEPEATERGTVRVREVGRGFEQEIQAGEHLWLADEPVALGGGDLGPNPYDLLLGALGACTSMTLRMYARHKGLDLEHVAVTLRHERVHAEDCADCEQGKGRRLERIERVIELEGRLEPAQRQRLLEIADRCPVHRTLEGLDAIVTRLA